MDIGSIGNNAQSGPLIAEKTITTTGTIAAQKQAIIPTQTVNAVTAAKVTPSIEQLNKAVSDINKTIQSLSQSIEFTVDKDSERVVVKIVDQQTNEVLRQIPTEEALEISKSLDKLQGLLIKQQA
jgi:flagellar protein FlaG